MLEYHFIGAVNEASSKLVISADFNTEIKESGLCMIYMFKNLTICGLLWLCSALVDFKAACFGSRTSLKH